MFQTFLWMMIGKLLITNKKPLKRKNREVPYHYVDLFIVPLTLVLFSIIIIICRWSIIELSLHHPRKSLSFVILRTCNKERFIDKWMKGVESFPY